MKFKRIISLATCIIFVLSGLVLAKETNIAKNQTSISLKNIKIDNRIMSFEVEPKGSASKITKVVTDSVTELKNTNSKYLDFIKESSYNVENDTVSILKLKNKHTITLTIDGAEHHFIYKVSDGKNAGEFETIDKAHPPKEVIHVKLDGYFESALKGQKKYDAISGATGSATANKNSNIRILVAETEGNVQPQEKDWKELHKSSIEVDKGNTKINLDPTSGMETMYNANTSAITLTGTPLKEGNYKITVDLVDVYGRKAVSNPAWFAISDIENTYLDEVFKNVNLKLKRTGNGKVLYNQDPWYIAYFNKDKDKKSHQTFIVPKNINLWQGSKESGVYGALGLIVKVNNNKKYEDRIPVEDFVLEKGTNLTLTNMKIYSGVNIIVNEGAVLNLHDCSVYGKITVKGGVLRVNYDPEGKGFADIDVKNEKDLISGTSIQGQIILENGAVLENSYIYSHTNNLNDDGPALQNIRPVVLVKGDAFIKGNVFVKGDESPTGNDIQTNLAYRGQNAMKIESGASVTISKDSSLYLYGGGQNATTSLGGNALELNGGQVLGEGTLVALGGTGHTKLGQDNVAGYSVTGKGSISTAKAYFRAGNAFSTDVEQKALGDDVKIHNNVIGIVKNTKPEETKDTYDEYWKRASIPRKLDNIIGNEKIKSDGEEKIEGKDIPAPIPGSEYKKSLSRVEFSTNNLNIRSTTVNVKGDGQKWIDEVKAGKATITLDGETLLKLEDTRDINKKGYYVQNNHFYINGLSGGEKILIKVAGFIDVSLKAEKVDDISTYNLVKVAGKEDEEKPYVELPTTDITDKSVSEARETVKKILKTIDRDKLKIEGVSTPRNESAINDFNKALDRVKELSEKDNLTDIDKKELVDFATLKENRYKGFENYTKAILPDLLIDGEKNVANKHDINRHHVILKNSSVTFESPLKNISKDGNPSIVIYRISKDKYEKKIDTITGATPKFEEEILDSKYFEIIKGENNKYTVSIKENLQIDMPDTELLKVVFRVKLYDGIYVENSDFVFLNNQNKVTPSPKPTPALEGPKEVESVTGQKIKVEKDITLKGHTEYENQTTGQRETSHYEYRKVTRNGEEKVYKTQNTKIEEGYIEGYPDGSFKPENSITRAEAATMMMKMQGNKASSSLNTGFSDAKDSWYNKAINYAVNNNMLLADGNQIRPDVAITRAEFARLVMPVLKDNKQRAPFEDIKGNKFEKAVDIAYSNGIIIGYPDGSFKPENSITRAEAVTMMNRISKKYLSLAELNSNSSKMRSFSDVLKNHWAYREIMSAINYNILNSRTEIVYGYEPTTYETLERVWVVDRPEKETVRREVAYENRVLRDSQNKIKVSGNIQKTAELKLKDKVINEHGENVIIIPQSAYQWLKSQTVNKYEILKSYQAYLTGSHKNKLEAVFEIGQNYDGKTLKVLHIVDGKIVETDVEAKDGKVSLNVDELNSFVILTEAKQQPKEEPKEPTAVEKVKKNIEAIGSVNSHSGEKIKTALTSYMKLGETDKKAVRVDKLIESIKEFSKLGQNKDITIKEGQGQVIDKETANLRPIISTADNKDFICVMMDENIVDEENYTRTDGSTKIEFKKEYINKLNPGSHNVLIVSLSGTAKTTLEINFKEKEKGKETDTVKFEEPGWIPTLKGIKVSKDEKSQEWLKAISEGRSEIKKSKGEKVEKQKPGKTGYSTNLETSTLQISGLSRDEKITVNVDGYKEIILMAKYDSFGTYSLEEVAKDSEKIVK